LDRYEINRYVENIVKLLIALMLVIASLATNAFAEKVDYELKVEGMKCAYCAYNVSKQLESLDGVVPRSVDVDLEQGRVTLRSERELEDARLAAVLLKAGFRLGAVTNSVAVVSQIQQQSDQAVLLRLIMQSDRISDGEFDAVLEALGDLAAEQSGRISVVGPVELEDTILKPVLAGRSTVIKVDFDRTNRPGQTVVVSLSAPSTKSH
jgi:copper chaperone